MPQTDLTDDALYHLKALSPSIDRHNTTLLQAIAICLGLCRELFIVILGYDRPFDALTSTDEWARVGQTL